MYDVERIKTISWYDLQHCAFLQMNLVMVFVPLFTPGRCMGSIGVAPLSLNLGTRWMWVVSSTPWPFKFQEKNTGTHWRWTREDLIFGEGKYF